MDVAENRGAAAGRLLAVLGQLSGVLVSNAAVQQPRSEIEWILLLPLGHVAIGLILPYVAVAFWLNRTLVDVGNGEISVTHVPLPFPGNRRLQVTDLRQLFCVERVRRKGNVTYDVMARLASDREVTVISGLSSDREARFLEERIEQRLGLANYPVAGELPGHSTR